MSERPRVLYLTGWMRSGSTILGNILGEIPGVLHVGELHYLWRNGVLDAGTNSLCGCGKHIVDCALWSDVLTSTNAIAEADAMVADQQQALRTRHTAARLRAGHGAGAVAAGRALQRTLEVYRAIEQTQGTRLIVDGSKYPAEAAALVRSGEVDARVLHIVRDPRATALSYRSVKDYIETMSPARSSGYWTAFNAASELVGRAAPERYLRVRYEDFCRRPADTIADVLRFARLEAANPVDEHGGVDLGENHTVTGNPDRLRRGYSVVKDDERWRAALPASACRAATVPALPFMLRYGYRPTVTRGGQ